MLRQSQAVAQAQQANVGESPTRFPFERVPGLSREMVQRFSESGQKRSARPNVFRVTPAAVAVSAPTSTLLNSTSLRNGLPRVLAVDRSVANREFRERLRRRAKSAGVSLEPALAEKLERYYQLLTKWNAKINLTAFG